MCHHYSQAHGVPRQAMRGPPAVAMHANFSRLSPPPLLPPAPCPPWPVIPWLDCALQAISRLFISHSTMPQQGPKGFRFGHLPKEVRKAVDGYNYLQEGRIPDNRCRPEAQMFMACMFEHTNSVSACRDEIVVLESCIAKLEANPVSDSSAVVTRQAQAWGPAVLRLTRRRVKRRRMARPAAHGCALPKLCHISARASLQSDKYRGCACVIRGLAC